MAKRSLIFEKLQYLCFLLTAFVIPLNRHLLPPVLIAYTICWIAELNFRERFRRLKENSMRWPFWIFISFYLIYSVSIVYTDNLKFGIEDLILKIPFLIIPVFIFTMDISKFKERNLTLAFEVFVIGCFIYALYTLYYVISYKNSYTLSNLSNVLAWNNASGCLTHRSYISMCYILSIAFIVYSYLKVKLKWYQVVFSIVMNLIFLIDIIGTSSRTAELVGIILLFMFLVYVIVQCLRKQIGFKVTLLVLSLYAAVFVFKFFEPATMNRLENTFQKIKTDKNIGSGDKARVYIWNKSLEVIKKRPIVGYGVGDIRDELTKSMYDREHTYNAHNQFFNTWIAVGLFAVFLLISIFVVSFIIALRGKSFLFFVFIVIIACNFMTESILERQLGVIFTVFFDCLFCLWIANRHKLKKV